MTRQQRRGACITLAAARTTPPVAPNLAASFGAFGHATLEFYAPHLVDVQTPHTRDEFYIAVEGSGVLEIAGDEHPFVAGDVLFVPAGAEHTFTRFSSDFAAWVIFVD